MTEVTKRDLSRLRQATGKELLGALATATGAHAQSELGALLGVTQPTIHKWLRGLSPMPQTARILACKLIAESM